ncbi:hypothetical protein AM1_D0026 (plasmid) [Acaryochloris marina MBIC11017]|uniref:Uncharacterized protein n=1 Tax=Acaryochloris marina (strain MBIC 11017) TaxID=329726 RepID=A8ZND7_ACAM1|nr:hypothetical protein AM1_D0026 [Acaryochloris marina MBIC11017]
MLLEFAAQRFLLKILAIVTDCIFCFDVLPLLALKYTQVNQSTIPSPKFFN